MNASIPRRHDLDALRAIAMLLGIALHGALAYMPLPEGAWPVQDSRQHEAFGVFMAAVHGFRMPLFFLISGFFTAMLWRKRGLQALLEHRVKRILLPLLIGMFTFVPAVWIVSIAAGITAPPAPISKTESGSVESNLWTAAKHGNLEVITQLMTTGASLDQHDPATGSTPLTMAARHGQVETVELLIASGADVNMSNRDGSMPIHSAVLFGRADSVRVLIDQGADIAARDSKGNTAADLLDTDWITTSIVAEINKVDIDRVKVESGREEIAGILQPDSLSTKKGERARTEEGLGGLFMLLMLFPFFHHLWFLAFLCWLVAAFALYAWVMNRTAWTPPKWLVVSPLRYAWLIPLTILPQSMMGLLYPTFGPDTSAGIMPMPHVLFYYAIFFFFGALYFDGNDHEGRVGRCWPLTIPISLLVVFPMGYDLTHGGFGFAGGWIDPAHQRAIAVTLQVVYVWLMTFGMMGLFRSLMSRESKTMRYVSDSSYWLYLAHLPLIIVAQAVVRSWEINSLAKFTIICVATSGLLLLSYQLFVRYTPIGTLLNGPRRRPKPIVDAVLVEPAATMEAS